MDNSEWLTLKLLILLRLKNRQRGVKKAFSRRWGIRPILRERKLVGEYVTSFLRYKISDHEWFICYTRMTPNQFDELLSILGPALKKESNREPLSPSQRLALTLRFLAQGDSVFSIASGYKVGRSTAAAVIVETIDALWEVLNGIVLKPWTIGDHKKIANQFYKRWDLPNTLGAIDGKHIAIQCPANSGSQYFNFKKHFSVVLFAICDAYYNFTYVNVGAYGSQSDGGILANSEFGDALANFKLQLPENGVLPNTNITMPHFFIGDDAFPLGPHLMKPYKGRNLTLPQKVFNNRLSRGRRVIENAFGILVARWRIFTRTIYSSPTTVDSIIKATVCLHNFIKAKEYSVVESGRKYCPSLFCDSENRGSIVEGQWRNEVGHFNIVLKELIKTGRRGNNPVKSALTIRDSLAEYLLSPAGAIYGQVEYVNTH